MEDMISNLIKNWEKEASYKLKAGMSLGCTVQLPQDASSASVGLPVLSTHVAISWHHLSCTVSEYMQTCCSMSRMYMLYAHYCKHCPQPGVRMGSCFGQMQRIGGQLITPSIPSHATVVLYTTVMT